MQFVMSWPKLHLAERSVSVEADELIAAAAHAEQLWDTKRDPMGGYSYSTATMQSADPPTKRPQ
jgi:hypothetical protein